MLEIMSFLKHTLPYLGMADYIFLLVIVFFIVLTIISFYLDGAFGAVVLMGAVVVGIMYYVNHIPYGVYQAKIVKVDDKVIGANTPESKPFRLNIDKKYVYKAKRKAVPLCKEKSNFYLTVYCNKSSYITITMMGTVKEKSLGWDFLDKEKSSIDYKLKVDY